MIYGPNVFKSRTEIYITHSFSTKKPCLPRPEHNAVYLLTGVCCQRGFANISYYIYSYHMIEYEWDEAKRLYNLNRHGLDFNEA